MSIIGHIFSGISKGNAAKAAANSQMIGAQGAQAEIRQGENQGKDFVNQEYGQQQANEAPYLATGNAAAQRLAQFNQTPFTAPTLAEAEQTPGYQFTLEQGTNAINQNAAANGTLLSGNTGTALEKYGQGLASTTYQQDYQNALNTYMANYNTLLGSTQVGQTAAGQSGQQGAEAAGQMANLDFGGAQAQAQQINNAAAARASGYIGKANALSNMATQVGGDISSAVMGNYVNGTPWTTGFGI